MFRQLLYIILFNFTALTVVYADDSQLSQQFTVCIDKSGGVTSSMIQCIAQETNYQDLRLNKAYKVLKNTLNSSRQQKLQDVQRLWIKYRDANCKFYYDPDGGSIAGVSSVDCFMNMTAERADELENFLQY